jgi:hypothetical protein
VAPDGVAGLRVSKYLALTMRSVARFLAQVVQARMSKERGASDAIGEEAEGTRMPCACSKSSKVQRMICTIRD